jgi:hypothetical protein
VSEKLSFKPVGGVLLRNRKREVVFWFKGKDEVGGSYGLCLFRPELADSAGMRLALKQAFRVIRAGAAKVGLPIFDMADFEAEAVRAFGELGVGVREYVRSSRVEDMTFKVTDLVSGRKVDVTFGIRPAKPRRRRKGERP